MKAKPESLDDLLQVAERYAEYCLRYTGRVAGTLLLQGSDGPSMFVPNRLDTIEAKNQFASQARQMAIAHGATAAVMVLEAWAVHAAPGVPLHPTLPPSESPQRQEIVALLGEANGVQRAVMLPIERHVAGGFSHFGPPQVQAADQAVGRFAQILPETPPTPEEQARAQAQLRAQGMRQEELSSQKTTTPHYWH